MARDLEPYTPRHNSLQSRGGDDKLSPDDLALQHYYDELRHDLHIEEMEEQLLLSALADVVKTVSIEKNRTRDLVVQTNERMRDREHETNERMRVREHETNERIREQEHKLSGLMKIEAARLAREDAERNATLQEIQELKRQIEEMRGEKSAERAARMERMLGAIEKVRGGRDSP